MVLKALCIRGFNFVPVRSNPMLISELQQATFLLHKRQLEMNQAIIANKQLDWLLIDVRVLSKTSLGSYLQKITNLRNTIKHISTIHYRLATLLFLVVYIVAKHSNKRGRELATYGLFMETRPYSSSVYFSIFVYATFRGKLKQIYL